MNHEFVTTLLVAVVTSLGGWFALYQGHKQKKTDEERSRKVQDSETWYRESRHNYEIAKKEAEQARQECSECTQELRKTRNAVYTLLEDLEDQVWPMLMLSGDPEVRSAMRATIRKAREAL
jgi:hypothetical protein